MALSEKNVQQAAKLVNGRIRVNAPLADFTSFRIGGPADAVVEPNSVQELVELVSYLRTERIYHVMLGAGTNVLFQDAGLRGVVVVSTGIRDMEIHASGSGRAEIRVSLGVHLNSLIKASCTTNLSGLEDLWGIPGSLGGAVVTNAGAGNTCIGDLIREISILDGRGRIVSLKRGDFSYGYRFMRLPENCIVLAAMLELHGADATRIQENLDKARSRRKGKQPLNLPSAGCIFKNPAGETAAGALIDQLGFKGLSRGGAQISPVHANFIVNTGGAAAQDVLQLISKIEDEVKKRYNITLECEIKIIPEVAPNA